MLGCDIHTKPNNGLFLTPLKKLVKFNKNLAKLIKLTLETKFPKIKSNFFCRKIAKFRQKTNLLMSTADENVKISAQNVLTDEVI
jgi:ribosome maturation factor RimP